MLGQEGDYWLRHNLDFHAALERVEPPLQEKHYFRVYSQASYQRHVALARDSVLFLQQLEASVLD